MKSIYAEDRDEWRAWLEKHHKTEKEIFLVYYKKDSGRPSITYPESVEEALCFGWIDGIRHAVDELSYRVRFTPRKPKSGWSKINIGYVEKLIAEGKMTEAGFAAIEEAKKSGAWDSAYRLKDERQMPDDFAKALKNNQKAEKFFSTLSNTNKFSYIRQVEKIKGAELRAQRLAKIIELLEQNIKPYVDGKPSWREY